MRSPLLLAFVAFLCASTVSFAQTIPPSPAAPTQEMDDDDAEDAAPATAAPATQGAKRKVCREAGVAKGARGPDLSDHIALCMAEARVECLRQAISQKIRGEARSDFIRQCITN